MGRPKHIVITRCSFSDDTLFNQYFDAMKKMYIPSINSQTDKHFSIALIVNPKHYQLIRSEIKKRIDIIPFSDTKKDYKEYVVENNITIQTRHDCDDEMSPDYIEYIHKLYNDNKNKYDDFILNFHPTKLMVKTGEEYTHGRDYSKVCSMFSTLIQKNVKHGIMDIVHDHLSRLTKNVIYIPKGYVKLGIHDNNRTSKLKDTDILIKPKKILKYEKTI